jgi:hypothetical protein
MAFFIELRENESDATGSCISVGSKMGIIALVKYLDILGHTICWDASGYPRPSTCSNMPN